MCIIYDVISESCFERTILHQGHFPKIPFLNSLAINLGAITLLCYIQICVIMRFVVKGLHSIIIYIADTQDGRSD